jgi:DNA-binding transcriptional LysR family regulator
MKLDGVSAFVTVVKTGSISEAARHLRLSKSAVSERLTELERALDANLIQRNSRQFALTEDGAAFLERAQRIVAEAEEATSELSRRRGEVAGPLRIACPRGFADTHLAAAIFSFMERYPDVSATVDADDRLVDAAGGFDAIIRISGAELPKLAQETITISRRYLVAAPSYLAQFGRPKTVEDLSSHKAIHYMERNPDDWSFRVANDLVVARVAPRLRVSSCLAMRDAAVAGLGIASLPTFHCHEGVKSGALEILDVGVDDDVTPITLAYQNGVKRSAKLSALIDHLKRAFGNPPYWDEGLPISPKA